MHTVRYNNRNREFFNTLKKRVDEHFKSKNISRNGDYRMVIKTIAMYGIYLTPFALMLTGAVTNGWLMLGLCVVMGIGMAGIGLAIMHDANHGSYSKNQKLNNWIGYSLNVIGGYSFNWKLQHNNIHHTFTNVEGVDEDIAPPGFLRFSPHAPLWKIHRFQHIYAWFFYGFMTLMWVTTKDFKQLSRYNKSGLMKQYKTSFTREFIKIFLCKISYYAVMLVMPFILLDLPWYSILGGFLIMQFVAGLILAAIFQPAHVVEETSFPTPDENGMLETDWAVHQMYTTANFAPDNKILSWYCGGLNYQVEHHLFPTICHVHYRDISPIVEKTAKEFGIPYYSQKTFRSALVSHVKMLKKFGTEKPEFIIVPARNAN